MRSRYSAYARGLAAYVLDTWHASTRPSALDLSTGPKWTGLTLLSHEVGAPDRATVEFVARYKVGGRAGKMHEISRFVRENARWYYVGGDTPLS
jgi:SEC-C motif-containing protein